MNQYGSAYSGDLGQSIREKMREFDSEDSDNRREEGIRDRMGKSHQFGNHIRVGDWSYGRVVHVGCAPDQEEEGWQEKMYER